MMMKPAGIVAVAFGGHRGGGTAGCGAAGTCRLRVVIQGGLAAS